MLHRRFVLNATLPRIIQRRILRLLPSELGRYLLDAGTGFQTNGEIGAAISPNSHRNIKPSLLAANCLLSNHMRYVCVWKAKVAYNSSTTSDTSVGIELKPG